MPRKGKPSWPVVDLTADEVGPSRVVSAPAVSNQASNTVYCVSQIEALAAPFVLTQPSDLFESCLQVVDLTKEPEAAAPTFKRKRKPKAAATAAAATPDEGTPPKRKRKNKAAEPAGAAAGAAAEEAQASE